MKPIKFLVLIVLLFATSMHNSAVAACTPLNAINVNYITTTGADLAWAQQSGVLGYQVCANTSPYPNLNQYTFYSIFPNYTISALDCGVKYYVFVRVVCAINDTSSWAMDSLTTVSCCKPPIPVTYSPIAKTSITVNMTPKSNALSYEYYVSPNLKLPSQSGVQTTNTTTQLQGLQPNTEYLVCTRSRCTVVDPISVWRCDTLKTAPPCDSITGLSKSSLGNMDYMLSWTPDPFANNYEYSISTDTQIPTSGTATQNTQVTVNGLTSKTLYTYCVRASCGTAGYYTAWTCDTLLTPVGVNIASVNKTDITLSPNPAKDYVIINRPNSLTKGTVRMTNMLGRVVLEQEVTEQKSKLNLTDISSGVYFIWYTDAHESSMFKIVVE